MFDLRVRYILFAALIGFVGGTTNFFYWYNIPIPPVGTILTSVYVALIAYAISHIRLLDIDRFFKFSAYFFVLYIAIVLPFSALISFIKSALLPYLHPYIASIESMTTSLLIDSVLWTLFIVGSYLILKLLERQTDRFLFMGDYNYVDVLDRISQKLPAITDIEELLSLLVTEIHNLMKIESNTIWLGKPAEIELNIPKNSGFIFNSEISPFSEISRDLILRLTTLLPIIFAQPGHAIYIDEVKFLAEGNDEMQDVRRIMDEMRVSILILSEEKGEISGILAVGRKTNGDVLKRKDVKLLAHLIDQGSLVLSKINQIKEKAHLQANLEAKDAYQKELQAANLDLKTALFNLEETQEKLVNSEKMAIIGRVAGGVAHDMRHPLSEIAEFVSVVNRKEYFEKNSTLIKYLLMQSDQKEWDHEEAKYALNVVLDNETKVQQSFQRIFTAYQQLRKFADDFLSYSRTSKDIPKNYVNIAPILKAMCRSIETRCRSLNIVAEFSADISAEVLILEHQLERIIQNLVNNAITELLNQPSDRKPRLAITLAQASPTSPIHDRVCITIEDNGGGISAEALPKIFEPFYTNRRDSNGTGLGLSIVKNLVELLKGSITVNSVAGVGTTFTIYFPARNIGPLN